MAKLLLINIDESKISGLWRSLRALFAPFSFLDKFRNLILFDAIIPVSDPDEKAEKIIEIMEAAVELKVPNKVDYESGANWGEIK